MYRCSFFISIHRCICSLGGFVSEKLFQLDALKKKYCQIRWRVLVLVEDPVGQLCRLLQHRPPRQPGLCRTRDIQVDRFEVLSRQIFRIWIFIAVEFYLCIHPFMILFCYIYTILRYTNSMQHSKYRYILLFIWMNSVQQQTNL